MKTGEDGKEWVNKDIRGDLIRMVNEKEAEKMPDFISALIYQFNQMRKELNEHLNFKSEKIQIQLTCYPGNRTGYKAHIDGTEKVKRRLTFLYYPNKSWNLSDGGELQIYLPKGK
eukprot:UN10739